MTYKLFNKSLHFEFRNGCGIDLEFPSGKAIWITRDGENLESAMFVGVIILLPFFQISFGSCYTEDEA